MQIIKEKYQIEETLGKKVKNMLSLKQKQDLIMNYVDSIEVIKMNDNVKIKNINFRNTFIKEFAKLFSDGGFANILMQVQIKILLKWKYVIQLQEKNQSNMLINYQDIVR